MNPYKQIAREHLSTEDLEELLAERKKPQLHKMSREEIEIERIIRKYGK